MEELEVLLSGARCYTFLAFGFGRVAGFYHEEKELVSDSLAHPLRASEGDKPATSHARCLPGCLFVDFAGWSIHHGQARNRHAPI